MFRIAVALVRSAPLAAALSVACSTGPSGEDARAREAAAAAFLARFEIHEGSANVLFTYVDEAGVFKTVSKSSDVPEEFRNAVIIVDLSKSPAERQSADHVVVADLNRMDAQGRFQLTLERRADFEQSIQLARRYRVTPVKQKAGLAALSGAGAGPGPAGTAANTPAPTPNTDRVILYSTSWCGYCRVLKSKLGQMKVPFTEKDIENDPAAAREVAAKCAQAGIDPSGVPILDYMGTMVAGYNPGALEQLVKAKGVPTAL